MTVPQETLWEIEPHTRAKHDILRKYLEAWFPILGRYSSRIIYVDGFCGPGRYKPTVPGSSGEIGSPLVALRAALVHKDRLPGEVVFWFIDERADRISHLRKELENWPRPKNFIIEIEEGRFHERFAPVLDDIESRGVNLAPTFAFIDPFGFAHIPFALVARVLQQPKCEAFITFNVDAINRWLEHPDPEIRNHIVEAFGTNRVLNILDDITRGGNRISSLRLLYQQQLESVANFVRYFEMRDADNRIIYYLFFATRHRLGHVKMKEAMWNVDPKGEFRFSDATDPNQIVLFEADVSPIVWAEMLKQFGKRTKEVSGREIREFIEDHTVFLKKHMTPVLVNAERNEKIKVSPRLLSGKKRIRGYPDDALIKFL